MTNTSVKFIYLSNTHSQMNKDCYILIILSLINLVIALFSFGSFLVEDAAIHGQISSLILENGFISDYLPVSDTLLTYPPLFHYLAAFLGLFMPIITAVRALGAVFFAIIPISVYFASKILTKKPIIPALFSVVMANISFILVFSAFPQLLALNLYLWFLFLFFNGKKILAGLFAGLAMLAHPFIGFFAMFTLFLLLVFYKKESLKTIGLSLLVFLLWAKQYIMIVINMFSNSWNNSRWVEIQGYHFEPFQSLINIIFFRLNIIIFALALIGIYLFLKSKIEMRKKIVLSCVFLLPLLFTIYHFGPAQYKFLDILSIPVLLFSGFVFSHKLKNKSVSGVFQNKKIVWFILVIFCMASLCLPVKNVYDFTYSKEKSFSAFDKKYYGAASWLRENRGDFSRVLLLDNSSIEKNPKSFSSELVFSQLAHKYPLDGVISDLEKYSESYKQQLHDRKLIIQGDYTLLKNYNVKYLVGHCTGRVIYDDGRVRICEIE